MPSVTIIGSGVFGLSIAYSLPLSYDITIVARNLPGDPDSLEWASPWAGAGFGGGSTQDPEQIDILKASFRWFWELAEKHPESSVKKMTEHLFRDNTDTDSDLWWKDFMPDYKILPQASLPPHSNAQIAISHTTLVMHANKYILWLHSRLLARGVRFVRASVASIAEVHSGVYNTEGGGVEPDVIVNATGVGALTLGGVEDLDVEPIRGQTLLLSDPHLKITTMTLRSGNDYCYIIPRGDGTVVVGGIKDFGDTSPEPNPTQRLSILTRAHELNTLIPPTPPTPTDDIHIIRDIVGIRPGRKTGLRVESEVIGGARVVHAYGGAGGGFALSAGVGRRVARLVDGFVHH